MYQSYVYNLINFYKVNTKEKLPPRSRKGILPVTQSITHLKVGIHQSRFPYFELYINGIYIYVSIHSVYLAFV